jgi:hypothetical protein
MSKNVRVVSQPSPCGQGGGHDQVEPSLGPSALGPLTNDSSAWLCARNCARLLDLPASLCLTDLLFDAMDGAPTAESCISETEQARSIVRCMSASFILTWKGGRAKSEKVNDDGGRRQSGSGWEREETVMGGEWQ